MTVTPTSPAVPSTIINLSNATLPLSGGEFFPLVQNNVTVKTPISQIIASGNVTSTTIPSTGNGIYLPFPNTVGIASNGSLVATFNSPGSGGNYLTFQNASTSGLSAIAAPAALTAALGSGAGNLSAGNYSYKVTFVGSLGETAVSPASNTVNIASPGTNGKMSLTAIHVSTNGTITARNIYRTTAGGSTFFFLHQIADNSTTIFTDNIADTSLTYSAPTSQSQLPAYLVIGAGATSDTSVGIQYRALGTTTTGNQYDGNLGTNSSPILSTGTHDFYCNNQKALRITDTYINASNPYNGATNTWAVISSGFNAPGSDGLAMISAEGSLYPGTSIGVGLVVGSKGAAGQIHFLSNGLLGHVTISPPTNPIAPDQFVACNSLRLQGSATGQGDVVIFSNTSGNIGDNGIGISFYNAGTGGFTFLSADTSALCLKIFGGAATAVNGLSITPAASGGLPFLGAGWAGPNTSGDANCSLGLTASGTGSVAMYNAGGTNHLMTFSGSGATVNTLSFAAATTGNAPAISAQGGDAGVGLVIYTTGTGAIDFYTSNIGVHVLSLQSSGIIKFPATGSSTANGAKAMALGSTGPTAANAAPQEWLTIMTPSGSTRYLPCF